jgi:hypothetical protein
MTFVVRPGFGTGLLVHDHGEHGEHVHHLGELEIAAGASEAWHASQHGHRQDDRAPTELVSNASEAGLLTFQKVDPAAQRVRIKATHIAMSAFPLDVFAVPVAETGKQPRPAASPPPRQPAGSHVAGILATNHAILN